VSIKKIALRPRDKKYDEVVPLIQVDGEGKGKVKYRRELGGVGGLNCLLD
jgi:hypothetical protein